MALVITPDLRRRNHNNRWDKWFLEERFWLQKEIDLSLVNTLEKHFTLPCYFEKSAKEADEEPFFHLESKRPRIGTW